MPGIKPGIFTSCDSFDRLSIRKKPGKAGFCKKDRFAIILIQIFGGYAILLRRFPVQLIT